MQLELPIRWDESTKEVNEIDEIKEKTKEKYSYSKLLISVHDIGPYYDLDENHTMINDKLGKVYCVTIPIDQFKKILTEITGNAIMTIQVREEFPKPSRRNPPKQKDDDDDMLR